MRKILFVCGANVDRSPTAEELFKDIDGLEVKSAGVSFGATNPITKELIEWSDEIYTMEFKQQQTVLRIMPSAWKKVECLEIPDIYFRGQPELKKLIAEKMKPYINLNKIEHKDKR
ncbi:MAG: phosphotyrosine protein phosphatase [Candidatus Bathyarchaeia archaeon]